MKLYKTYAEQQFGDPPTATTRTKWSGSQAEAASQRKYFNSNMKIPRDSIHTDEVDVPTDKKGLLNFLNGDDV